MKYEICCGFQFKILKTQNYFHLEVKPHRRLKAKKNLGVCLFVNRKIIQFLGQTLHGLEFR